MTRTTIRIRTSLLEALKERARKNKRSLAKELDAALEGVVYGQPAARDRIELPVFTGGGGLMPGVDLTKTAELFELSEQ